MGIDMYACKTREDVEDVTDFDTEESETLYHWRNHDNLNLWMVELYLWKGGQDAGSNCTVMLEAHDLDVLDGALERGELPDIGGSRVSDGDMLSGDQRFVRLAREALADGYSVFYFIE